MSQTGRPVTHHVSSIHRKSLNVPMSRSIKPRDDVLLGSSSAERPSFDGSSNLGKIMNFTRMAGINDMVKNENMRQWTGIPQTTRNSKVPSLNLNQKKLVAHHRKTTQNEEVYDKTTASMNRAPASSHEARRNISKTAWNKIRLVELKKKDRLSFKQ